MSKNSYHVETLSVGQLATNCYIVFDTKTKDAVIIDPGDDGNYIAEKILALQIHPHAILLTHGHFDHMLGAYELQKILNIPVYMNKKDNFLVQRMKESAEYYLHRAIVEQKPILRAISAKKLVFGTISVDIIDTPGHTPGSVSFVFPDMHAVFTGDTVFAEGGVGRTDFWYSSQEKLDNSVKKIFLLPEDYSMYPGHGKISTIGQEKRI